MADKTYLQLINKVLINLREDQVTSLNADYTLLLGEFINQAKEMVEDSWKWHRLRKNIEFTTTATNTYDLNDVAIVGADPAPAWVHGRSHIIRDQWRTALVWNITQGDRGRLAEINKNQGLNEIATDDNVSTAERPDRWFMDVATLTFTRYTLAGHDIRVTAFIPQDELDTITDTLTVPWRPVVDMATALAYDERGEELGNSFDTYTQKYAESLARAISNDTLGEEDELVMRTV